MVEFMNLCPKNYVRTGKKGCWAWIMRFLALAWDCQTHDFISCTSQSNNQNMFGLSKRPPSFVNCWDIRALFPVRDSTVRQLLFPDFGLLKEPPNNPKIYIYIYIFLISFQFIEPWFQPHSRHLSTSLYPHRSMTFYRFPYASPKTGLIATPEMRLEVVEDASKLAKNVAWGCNWIKHPETWCWKHEKYRGARLRIFKNKQEMGFLQQVELTKKKVGLMQTTHDLAKTHVDLATKSCILN